MVIALTLRISFILSTAEWPEFNTPLHGMDVDLLWQSAIELNNNSPEQPRFALMQASAPGFSFLLAGTQKLLGLSIYKHRFLMALIGSATVLLLMMAAWSWSKDKCTTLATGLLAALYPVSIYADTQLIKTGPELLLITIVFVWMFNFRCQSFFQAMVHGTSLSILLLCLIASQFSTVLLPFAVMLWIMAMKNIALNQRLLAASTVFVLVTAGASVLQKTELWMPDKYGAFLPVSGVHAAIGFHNNATGNYHNIPGVPASPSGHAFISRIVAENATGHRLTPSESNKYWQEKTLRFITEKPVNTLRIIVNKLHLILSSHEAKANEYIPSIQSRSWLLQWQPLNWGILLILATFGLLNNQSQRDIHIPPIICFMLCVATANLITFVTWRYRMHALVPLFLLAGSGLSYLIDLTNRYIKTRKIPGLLRNDLSYWLLAVLLGIVSFIPLPEAVVNDMEARSQHNDDIYVQMRSIDNELATLQKNTGTASSMKQALLLQKLQRHTESYSRLASIMEKTTDSPEANALWLNYLAWLGDTEQSRRFIATLLKEKPAILAETWRKLPPLIQSRCQKLDLVPKPE